MESTFTTYLSLILAVVLFWTSGAKLLPSARLATSPEMTWARRPGLASGTIAGIVELIAAALLLLSALVFSMELVVLLVGFGIAAHMAVAASKAEDAIEAEDQSRVPNWVIAALGLMVAMAVLLT